MSRRGSSSGAPEKSSSACQLEGCSPPWGKTWSKHFHDFVTGTTGPYDEVIPRADVMEGSRPPTNTRRRGGGHRGAASHPHLRNPEKAEEAAEYGTLPALCFRRERRDRRLSGPAGHTSRGRNLELVQQTGPVISVFCAKGRFPRRPEKDVPVNLISSESTRVG